MVTMVDVARLAHVSTSTVSHVLNGTRPVEEATRRRVVEAIARTGYHQDAVARALRRARTDSIGLVVSDASEPAFAEMVHGVEQTADTHRMTLLLANSGEDPDRELRAVRTLLGRRVDGLILARCPASAPSVIHSIVDAQVPAVLLDRLYDDTPFDQVSADNRESMRRLVAHQLERGHRRLLLVAGDTRVPTMRERCDGFLDATADCRPDQVILEGRDPAERAAGLREALRTGSVSCVVAASTPLAVDALEAIRDQGLLIPGDIAFATFDGFAHSDLFKPAITTVRQPAFEMGSAAVNMLLERLRTPAGAPRMLRLRQTIELRSSTEDHLR